MCDNTKNKTKKDIYVLNTTLKYLFENFPKCLLKLIKIKNPRSL